MLNFQNWSEWTDHSDVNIERVKTSDCSFKDGPGLKLHSFFGPAGDSALMMRCFGLFTHPGNLSGFCGHSGECVVNKVLWCWMSLSVIRISASRAPSLCCRLPPRLCCTATPSCWPRCQVRPPLWGAPAPTLPLPSRPCHPVEAMSWRWGTPLSTPAVTTTCTYITTITTTTLWVRRRRHAPRHRVPCPAPPTCTSTTNPTLPSPPPLPCTTLPVRTPYTRTRSGGWWSSALSECDVRWTDFYCLCSKKLNK